jgi:ABC-type Fe3+/spermidine/putrescine transport system ATPase subunit
VSKNYQGFSLQDVSLEIQTGEYFALLGKSGSGKSMLLEMIAGFRTPDAGSIIMNGIDMRHHRVQQRNCILLHQDSTLFPHLTVYNNIGYALRSRGVSSADARPLIEQMAGYVSVQHLLHRSPASLSGGEIRRVALARSLVVKPHVLMLDEPLVALDPELKRELQTLLWKISKEGQTILHVTHDFKEAVSLSDKMAILDAGSMVVQGTTHELVKHISNPFVAKLAEHRNFFEAHLLDSHAGSHAKIAQPIGTDLRFSLHAELLPCSGYLSFQTHDVEILSAPAQTDEGSNCYRGLIVDLVPQHDGYEVVVDIGLPVYAFLSRNYWPCYDVDLGQNIWIQIKPDACRFIPK